MTEDQDRPNGGGTITLPQDWGGDVDVDQTSENICVVRRRNEDGIVPPLAIEAHSRPILVEVHFGRSAVVPTPIDAIRFGYQQRGFRTDFYYLDIMNEPEWHQISEEMDDPAVSIYENIDSWIEEGEISEAEGEWAREQFE